MDKEILDALWAIKDLDFSEKKRIEFTERIALLLKFEWQRAKIEARPYCKKEDARIQYSQFDNKRFPPE
jgi:hypothetical protein